MEVHIVSEKRVKLTSGVEYKELYSSMEKTILEWEKQNLGNPYFCKFNSPVVKQLNDELLHDYIVLQEDGNVSIASPLVFLEADIKKWKNVKSVVSTVALTENGEVFSANLPFERNRANMQDSDFTDWQDVEEIYSASTPRAIGGNQDVVALQKDGRIRWRENNLFKGNLVVEETSAWKNVKKLYIFDTIDTYKLVVAAVDFDGNILVSGDDELKKRVTFLSSSPKKIVFTIKHDIIALYDDGHIECAFDDELSEMLNSFNMVENIFAENEYSPNILVVQKDNANSIFYVYQDSEVEINIERIDLPFDEICMLNDMWKSPICIEYKHQKTYYTWEIAEVGRELKPFEEMNRFKWEDLAGIAYEKAGMGKVFLKRNGTLILNRDNDYIHSIKNVKEAGIIDSTLIILKDNNDFEIHDYYAETKYITIANCDKFLILNLSGPHYRLLGSQHIFVLHNKQLTVYTRPFSRSSVKPQVCGEYDNVKNIFMAPNGETVCVRFNNGRLKTFGEYIFDSDIDFDGASMYYYGPKLEDGAMKLLSKFEFYNERKDGVSDNRGEFTGIFGLQKNGKCFVLTNKNWLQDYYWYLDADSSFLMERNCDIKEIVPSRFLYLNKSNILKSFRFPIMQQAITSFSASIYYEVFVNFDGVIDGTRGTFYGCCKFAGVGPVKKALAFPMGTVVLTQDGKLKSLCNKATARAYENLPVKNRVKDILANYSLFAILCENGDLYVCKRQKAVYYYYGFEQKPFAEWQLVMTGVEKLESNGEETFAVLKE